MKNLKLKIDLSISNFDRKGIDIIRIYIDKENKILNSEVECILRNYINKPIKGEITKRKLILRHIKSKAFNSMGQFLGIIQENNLITKDGYKIPIINNKIILNKKVKINE